MRVFTFIVLAILMLPIISSAEQLVRVPPQRTYEDQSHPYFVSLLRLALDKTPEYGSTTIKITDFNVTQGRGLYALAHSNRLDVYWAGTNVQRETDLRPIRIPLVGGLLGYRVPVIRKDSVTTFSKVRTLDELKSFSAVQGMHWPDSDILELAGLRIIRMPSFDEMYTMLKLKRVDYFPRGINEVYAEIRGTKDDTIVAYDSLLITYTLPMYFFTSRNNEALATRIETGLRRAITDGSFRKHLMTHPVTAKIFPLSQYDNAVVIHLDNPMLPPETPLHNATLWLHIGRDTTGE